MAASLWNLRQFQAPVQRAAGLPGASSSVFVRFASRTRKSSQEYLGLKRIWDRPVPQHEWIKPTRGRPWSRLTIERRLRPRPTWAITAEELRQIRERHNTGSRVKTPLHLRPLRPATTVEALKEQEKQRILQEFPREIDDFKAGDRIEVHRYLELGKPKFEIVKGICLSRRKRGELSATFRVLCVLEETPFVMTYPLHSPYITKVKVVNKGSWKRNRLDFLKTLPIEELLML